MTGIRRWATMDPTGYDARSAIDELVELLAALAYCHPMMTICPSSYSNCPCTPNLCPSFAQVQSSHVILS